MILLPGNGYHPKRRDGGLPSNRRLLPTATRKVRYILRRLVVCIIVCMLQGCATTSQGHCRGYGMTRITPDNPCYNGNVVCVDDAVVVYEGCE